MKKNWIEYSKKFTSVGGVDEVGRGALAGPIVVSGCILSTEKIKNIPNNLINIIKDSKKMTQLQRIKVRNYIDSVGIEYKIFKLGPEEIDTGGISKANISLFLQAIEWLKSLNTEYIFTDWVSKIPLIEKVKTVIRGESYSLSVAISSIIAKTERDSIMKRLSKKVPIYGWEKNMGYGTKEHIESIKKYGVNLHHRKSFLKNYSRT